MRLRIQKEIEAQNRTGLEKIAGSIHSLPGKTIFTTITAVAAVAAVAVVLDSQFFNNDDKTVITPRIEIPRPGNAQINQSPITIGAVGDSTAFENSFINSRNTHKEDILKNLGAQSQAIKDKKEQR